jgi:predicted amidohydrolase YtcJ
MGGLDPGKWADFIIVDRDISKASVPDIYAAQVEETWVGGKKVWTRAASAAAPTPERGR